MRHSCGRRTRTGPLGYEPSELPITPPRNLKKQLNIAIIIKAQSYYYALIRHILHYKYKHYLDLHQ